MTPAALKAFWRRICVQSFGQPVQQHFKPWTIKVPVWRW